MLIKSGGFSRVGRLALVAVILFLCPNGYGQQAGDKTASEYFTVKQVVPGVWAFLAKPGKPAASNAAIIELGDRVMVVDSHLSPSAAREAARLIAAVTSNKPVRYLINTHWHPDHVQGNSAYRAAFPGLIDIVSHVNTRRDITRLVTPFLKDQKIAMPKQITQMKSVLDAGMIEGKPITAEQKRRLEAQISQTEALLREIENLEVTLPNLILDRSMSIHAGEREVRILYFGRGHTEGDVVVYLPREQVLVTGDLVTNSIPLMRDAYPLEWSETLSGVEALDYTHTIPGHGDVQQGKERIKMLRALLDDVAVAVRRAITEGKSLDDAKKSIKAELAPRHEKNFPSWNGGAEATIERTYNHLKESRK